MSEMYKPDNAVKMTVGLAKVYKHWLTFLRAINKLTNSEIKLGTELLLKRHELQKKINDETIVDSALMSTEVRNEIIGKLGMDKRYFQVMMSRMRAKKFIVNNRINPKFVPMIKDKNTFKVLILFDITDNNKEVQNTEEEVKNGE